VITDADHELAHRLATDAGKLLIALREEHHDAPPQVLKSLGDREANAYLMAELRRERPDDGILSEEEREHPDEEAARLASRRVWIIDPLDGTREFGEVPRPDWAVHVALCLDGDPLCGAVSLPALDVTYSTLDPPTLPPPIDGPPRVVVSRSRAPYVALRIAEALDADLVSLGSAGAKAMTIIRGEADLYPHAGGQYEWDSCAPVAVARAAGCWCSRIDGSPLIYNEPDPYLPDLLICRPELADAAIEAIVHR